MKFVPFKCQSYRSKFLKTGWPKNMPRCLPGFVPGHSGEIAPFVFILSSAESKLFTPERVKLTANIKKETNRRVKMGQKSRWAAAVYPLKELNSSEQQERNRWQGQNGPRVKMGYCCLPPERVELTVNSKKETNGRVKMGQESRGLKSNFNTTESNWAKRGQCLGQVGLGPFDSESNWAKDSIWVGTIILVLDCETCWQLRN